MQVVSATSVSAESLGGSVGDPLTGITAVRKAMFVMRNGKVYKEHQMNDTVVDALILDLLEWLDNHERSYEEVMDAWRTSCPKLPVWEDANDRKLVEQAISSGRSVIKVTSLGREFLEQRERAH
jgi:hypothetical protein